MVKKQTDEQSCSVLHSVLPAARSIAVLFGFDKSAGDSPYVESHYGDSSYAIIKKTLPNNFARIDVIFVNNEPAGSLLFVEIADSIFHMVGMFINEKFRGKKLTYDFSGKTTKNSIAFFLLQHVMADLVSQEITVTLEVMNYNVAAYKLYERLELFDSTFYTRFSFKILTKKEVRKYSELRRKPIKKWHDIGLGSDEVGVQWTHIPDYNGEPKYSVSRIYCCETVKGVYDIGKFQYYLNKVKLVISLIKYGRPITFLLSKILSQK